ncbi:MAG TPA: glycoside hydrolase family 97 catalytic domain-containing protein [Anaerohalosphaeraceae bacterium]|nr:glycoside hydrolase family 97 catalytic domain-containing protein [Anaerohalosphaeraceae bacterium]HOM75242.1 glycoside hydrolase family 97 catalytic domain-containing protein [Anaerohalosphaeraceae bacterium]HPC64525.1 glycoside hydrolase family 97 catalytic domain-containing protein [Anaerohalosphaeraceae bacterium]HPO69446.1 glycoside hydrolase family 97 catalytic domain-containing protein [Anaerohalosphaeraceae bacterium]HRS71507.1 glycoside hydrolase family 97 catalytic domain-containin
MQAINRKYAFAAIILYAAALTFAQAERQQPRQQRTNRSTTRRTQRVIPMKEVRLVSPDGKVSFIIDSNPERLTWSAMIESTIVIEPSPLDMRIDGYDISSGVIFNALQEYSIDEAYPWHGAHSRAVNRCNGARITYTHDLSQIPYILEVRVFNDGVAYRHIIDGNAEAVRTPNEYSRFILPAGTTVWYHDLDGHYEAEYTKQDISDVKAGQWAGPPLTFQLPDGAGYGSITEANLVNYSGMALENDGRRGWIIGLGHRQPVNYPYELRYGRDEAKRLAVPAAISGSITTPWRVVFIARDLNVLVNSDILPNLCPPADPQYFPQGMDTPWVEPGLCVWDYVDRNYVRNEDADQFQRMKDFSRMAGQIGAKYHILEGFAYGWSDEQIREFTDYSKQQGVRVLFWRHSRNLRTPEQREEFFARLNRLGVAGAKIDFFDHEAKENIDLYEALLEKAAHYQCVIDFHGANKPTGRLRTWPNAMIYEAVRGMESSSLQQRARHETILPFTRYLAGPCDYTTMVFNDRRRDSTWAHQIACLATFHSPILTIAAHPQSVLDNPALEVIKSIKPVWDETIVLPDSRIGELSIFARRSGDMWMLAITAAGPSRTLQVPLSFLSEGAYKAIYVRDNMNKPDAVVVEKSTASKNEILTIQLADGGGFIGQFVK